MRAISHVLDIMMVDHFIVKLHVGKGRLQCLTKRDSNGHTIAYVDCV